MAKKKLAPNLADWIAARRRHHLSHAQVQMARELGLNPRKLGALANHDQEAWKAPLPQFIEHLYENRFGRAAPAVVTSIEERARAQERKRAERKAAKRRRRETPAEAEMRADADLVDSHREILVSGPVPGLSDDLPRSAVPAHRVSDALLEIVKPLMRWPPAPSELKDVRSTLELGRAVWNAIVTSRPEDRDEALDRLADRLAGALGAPPDVARDFVRRVAARKLDLYPADLRFVVGVEVRLDGDRMIVNAAGAYRPA